MTATERLDQIEARTNAATDGPWTYIGRNWMETPPIEVDEADWGPEGHHGIRIHTAQEARAYRYADAEFIAAARQDVPDLVAGLRAVLDLHQPEPRYFYGDDERLLSTEQDCLDWYDVGDQAIAVRSLDICAHCRATETGLCDDGAQHDYDPDVTYWPCPTVRAIDEVLGGAR